MPGRRTHAVRGIVLARTALSEKDYIVTALADTGVQLRMVAKGARRPGGKLAGRVELFCETEFFVAEGRNFGTITEAKAVNAHMGLRDYERAAAAAAVCEIARLTCFEDAEDPYLHPILSRTLTALEEAADRAHIDLSLAAYAMKVLAHGGWYPELDACVACSDEHPSYFVPAAGGVLCESCAHEIEGALPLTSSQLAWMHALLRSTFDELGSAAIDAECALFLAGIAHSWASTHLDARLKAYEFYMSLGD